jgi:hypothetical protein
MRNRHFVAFSALDSLLFYQLQRHVVQCGVQEDPITTIGRDVMLRRCVLTNNALVIVLREK